MYWFMSWSNKTLNLKPQKEKATKTPSKKVRVSFAPDNFEFKLNSPPLTSEPAQSRGRRRSRRISGVQPDPTLSQEDLCMTPAKRAKDRPASRDRRQSLQCGMCPKDHTWATPRGWAPRQLSLRPTQGNRKLYKVNVTYNIWNYLSAKYLIFQGSDLFWVGSCYWIKNQT